MKITIEDGRTSFYQWDLDRRLRLEGVSPGCLVQFCRGNGSAYTVVTFEENGETFAKVPNAWLQNTGTFSVYICCENTYVACKHSFYIHPRPKPDDYVYTETEVLSYKSIDERMRRLESDLDDQVEESVEKYLVENPIDSGLPTVTAADNGKVLTVVGGKWEAAAIGTVSDEEIAQLSAALN